ncbi:MAG: hypothetical protein K6E30_01665 [Lachnospiraceae bacterium]|nr:hypothetical protein [Lachnospiraceae bacterium]
MDLNLNSPFNSEAFAGDGFGKKLVIGSFETPEYYASKGLVTSWQRNRRNSLMDKLKRDGTPPIDKDWEKDKFV